MEFTAPEDIRAETSTLKDLLFKYLNRHHEIVVRSLDNFKQFEWFAVEASMKTLHAVFGPHLDADYRESYQEIEQRAETAITRGDKRKYLNALTDWMFLFSANMGGLGVIPTKEVTVIASPIFPELIEGGWEKMDELVEEYRKDMEAQGKDVKEIKNVISTA